jgi:hypothetical protein
MQRRDPQKLYRPPGITMIAVGLTCAGTAVTIWQPAHWQVLALPAWVISVVFALAATVANSGHHVVGSACLILSILGLVFTFAH